MGLLLGWSQPAAATPIVSEPMSPWPAPATTATSLSSVAFGSNGNQSLVAWTRSSLSDPAPWLPYRRSADYVARLEGGVVGAPLLLGATDAFRPDTAGSSQGLSYVAVNGNGTGLVLSNGHLFRVAAEALTMTPLTTELDGQYLHGSSVYSVSTEPGGRFLLVQCSSRECKVALLDDAGSEVLPWTQAFEWSADNAIGTFRGFSVNVASDWHAGEFSFVASYKRQVHLVRIDANNALQHQELLSQTAMDPPCTDSWYGIGNLLYSRHDDRGSVLIEKMCGTSEPRVESIWMGVAPFTARAGAAASCPLFESCQLHSLEGTLALESRQALTTVYGTAHTTPLQGTHTCQSAGARLSCAFGDGTIRTYSPTLQAEETARFQPTVTSIASARLFGDAPAIRVGSRVPESTLDRLDGDLVAPIGINPSGELVDAVAELAPDRWLVESRGALSLVPGTPVGSGWMSHGSGTTLALSWSMVIDDAGAPGEPRPYNLYVDRFLDTELLAGEQPAHEPVLIGALPADPRSGEPQRGDAAFDGTNHLYVWIAGLHLQGILLAADGRVVQPPFEVANAFYAQSEPRVVGLPQGGFLVAWVDRRRDAIKSDIYVRRFDPSGRAIDPPAGVALSTGEAFEGKVALGVAPDGDHVLVVWGDARNARPAASTDVFGARLSVRGVLRDPIGFPIATEDGDKLPVDVRRDADGSISVYYLQDDASFGGQRVLVRKVDIGKRRNDACTDANQCASLLCQDGRCVDDPCDAPCGDFVDGLCTPKPRGSTPAEFQCLGYVCDGQNTQCPSTCTTQEECAGGATCQDQRCFVKKACFDSATRVVEGARQSCAPYTCDPTASDCRTRCSSIDECAPGSVCDASGVCRSAPEPAVGCAAHGAEGSVEWLSSLAAFALCATALRWRRAGRPR